MENKERSYLSFYLATEVISPNLTELRDNPRMRKFLAQTGGSILSTRLHESTNKIHSFILDKDPTHTHRDTLANRLEAHISKYTTKNRRIPVGVITTTVASSKVSAMIVGTSDIKIVTKLLDEQPFPHLELAPFSLKRKDTKQFEDRIRQHDMVVDQTKAFKISGLPHNQIDNFRADMFNSSAAPSIVDVMEASHVAKTGVVYIQYIECHKDSVLLSLQDILEQYSPAELHDPERSVTATVQSTRVSSDIPQSRFANVLDPRRPLEQRQPPRRPQRRATIPKAISTSAKSYAQALLGDLPDDQLTDSDSEDSEASSDAETVSTDNRTRGNVSTKTAKEVKLEEENNELKAAVHTLKSEKAHMQIAINNLTKQQTADRATHHATMQSLKQQQEAQYLDQQKRISQLEDMMQSLLGNQTLPTQVAAAPASPPTSKVTGPRHPDRTPTTHSKKPCIRQSPTVQNFPRPPPQPAQGSAVAARSNPHPITKQPATASTIQQGSIDSDDKKDA